MVSPHFPLSGYSIALLFEKINFFLGGVFSLITLIFPVAAKADYFALFLTNCPSSSLFIVFNLHKYILYSSTYTGAK